MDLFRWLARDHSPGTPGDLRWAWLTLGLSAMVVGAYGVIAFNRYFQTKIGRYDDSRRAAACLRNVALFCCVSGVAFYLSDMPWATWRLYDVMLVAVACYAWWFALRMRGLSLVEARLGQVEEAERAAREQRAIAAEKDRQAQQKAFYLNALSHDLRAPLNIVALNAHLLKTSAKEAGEVESAKLIIENALAAGNLVAKALELARADALDVNHTDVVPLPDLLNEVVRRFTPAASQKGLYLRVTGSSDFEVHTDRQKLDRVISNLVDNAIKFTDRGGVTIEVVPGDELVGVRVIDTGIGVPEHSTPFVFEQFYQAGDRAGDRAGHRGESRPDDSLGDAANGRRGGFGMGLAICRLLARQLGGDVRLVSTGPQGSCFEATFLARPARGETAVDDRMRHSETALAGRGVSRSG